MNGQSNNQKIVSLYSVSKVFDRIEHQTPAVSSISFDARPGELVLILGPSGSGKTTLLTLIAGLARPTRGTVSLFGMELEHYSARDLQLLRAKKMGFVFQTFQLINALTAKENIELVVDFADLESSSACRKAELVLERLHIGHLANKFPFEMSQGEKQRIAVARAIVNDPELILADEPTANLESVQGFEVIRLLDHYAKSHQCCVIVASHDLRLRSFADRVLVITDGKISDQ